MTDGYAEGVMEGFRRISRHTDLTIFTGWSRGLWHSFSRCCSAEIYVKRPDYYAGIPSCTRCHKSLGPDDLRQEWVPPYKNDPHTTMDCPWPTEPEDE